MPGESCAVGMLRQLLFSGRVRNAPTRDAQSSYHVRQLQAQGNRKKLIDRPSTHAVPANLHLSPLPGKPLHSFDFVEYPELVNRYLQAISQLLPPSTTMAETSDDC